MDAIVAIVGIRRGVDKAGHVLCEPMGYVEALIGVGVDRKRQEPVMQLIVLGALTSKNIRRNKYQLWRVHFLLVSLCSARERDRSARPPSPEAGWQILSTKKGSYWC